MARRKRKRRHYGAVGPSAGKFLTKGEVRAASRELKTIGRKLPKIGRCSTNLPAGQFPARELCHIHTQYHPTGYFWVGFHR